MLVRALVPHCPHLPHVHALGTSVRGSWGGPETLLVHGNPIFPLPGAGYGSYGYGGNSATAGYSKCVSLCLTWEAAAV